MTMYITNNNEKIDLTGYILGKYISISITSCNNHLITNLSKIDTITGYIHRHTL